MAPSEMMVLAERLDREFLALTEAEGVTDADECLEGIVYGRFLDPEPAEPGGRAAAPEGARGAHPGDPSGNGRGSG